MTAWLALISHGYLTRLVANMPDAAAQHAHSPWRFTDYSADTDSTDSNDRSSGVSVQMPYALVFTAIRPVQRLIPFEVSAKVTCVLESKQILQFW